MQDYPHEISIREESDQWSLDQIVFYSDCTCGWESSVYFESDEEAKTDGQKHIEGAEK